MVAPGNHHERRWLQRPASNAFIKNLDDFLRSGHYRGHMSSIGDMFSPEAQQKSFTLANITPQDLCNNEVLWGGVESAVCTLMWWTAPASGLESFLR